MIADPSFPKAPHPCSIPVRNDETDRGRFRKDPHRIKPFDLIRIYML